MKTIIFLLCMIVGPLTTQLHSQTLANSAADNNMEAVIHSPEDSTESTEKSQVLTEQPTSSGVVVIQTKDNEDSEKKCATETFPFRVYCLKNENWVLPRDITIALRAKIPSLTVSNDVNSFTTPVIRLRGNDAPIILLDGIRVDASILNTLNPNDIESIMVAPSAAGTNYFLNGYRNY